MLNKVLTSALLVLIGGASIWAATTEAEKCPVSAVVNAPEHARRPCCHNNFICR